MCVVSEQNVNSRSWYDLEEGARCDPFSSSSFSRQKKKTLISPLKIRRNQILKKRQKTLFFFLAFVYSRFQLLFGNKSFGALHVPAYVCSVCVCMCVYK